MDYTESNNMQSASKIRRAAYGRQACRLNCTWHFRQI
jgi:hypothetical protein